MFAMLEHLEENHVDRNVALVEITDDPLGGGVNLRSCDDDLVGVIERVLVQWCAEVLLERLFQAPAVGETAIDLNQPIRCQILQPGGVVQSLGHDLAWSSVALQLNQHQRSIGSDRQQIDAAAEGSDLLPADEHPLVGQDAGVADDHVFQQLLAGQFAIGECPGL